MAIDQGLTEFFRANGYAVVGKVLEDAELAALRQAYDRIFQAEEKPGSYRNLSETQGGENTGQAVLQIINMYELDEAFRRALFKENLLGYARAFADSAALRLYHDQALYKPAWTGGCGSLASG